MSRVYEALQKAEKERKRKVTRTVRTGVSNAKPVYEEKKDEKERTKWNKGLKIKGKEVVKDQINNLLVTLQDPLSQSADQFMKVCVRMAKNGQHGKRVVMISSPLPEEGKTMIASNLAIGLARLPGTHVTLIDADLRKPSVHKMLGVPIGKGKGLTEYLEQKADISQIYYETPVPRLFIVPASKEYLHPERILSSDMVQRLLEEIQAKHPAGYVVIDSSPILLSAEPEILLNHVDSIIMVVQYGKTHKDNLQKALGLLDKKKIIGIIFSQIELGFFAKWLNMVAATDYYHSRKG